MSSYVVEDFSAPWTADASGLWTLTSDPKAAHFPGRGNGMNIEAAGGATAAHPYAEHEFKAPLDLRNFQELRFWFRANRTGEGATAPFFLVLEAFSSPAATVPGWQRPIAVTSPQTWELQTLWLGDMPSALRGSVGLLRLRSLDGAAFFSARMDRLVAATPEPVQDLDAALLTRFDKQFQALVAGTLTSVPVVLDVPESPGTRNAPYILITALSIRPSWDVGSESGGGILDNYTSTSAFERPLPCPYNFEFRIDIYAQDRGQKAWLLDNLLASLNRNPELVVNEESVAMTLYTPPVESILAVDPTPGRTPFFVRVTLRVETGTRQMLGMAVPFVLVGPLDDVEQAELAVP